MIVASIAIEGAGQFASQVVEFIVSQWPIEVARAAKTEAGKPSKSGKVTLPDSDQFRRSFVAKARGTTLVELHTDYPSIDKMIEGSPSFPMPWLTKARGVGFVPVTRKDGSVVLRSTPKDPSKAWVHPGFEKHEFLKLSVDRVLEGVPAVVERAFIDAVKRGRF
jgi:hypothetical protein